MLGTGNLVKPNAAANRGGCPGIALETNARFCRGVAGRLRSPHHFGLCPVKNMVGVQEGTMNLKAGQRQHDSPSDLDIWDRRSCGRRDYGGYPNGSEGQCIGVNKQTHSRMAEAAHAYSSGTVGACCERESELLAVWHTAEGVSWVLGCAHMKAHQATSRRKRIVPVLS